MTIKQAILAAIRQAKKNGIEYYIVQEEGKYFAITDFGLQNFWLGQPVLLTITPDGEVIQ